MFLLHLLGWYCKAACTKCQVPLVGGVEGGSTEHIRISPASPTDLKKNTGKGTCLFGIWSPFPFSRQHVFRRVDAEDAKSLVPWQKYRSRVLTKRMLFLVLNVTWGPYVLRKDLPFHVNLGMLRPTCAIDRLYDVASHPFMWPKESPQPLGCQSLLDNPVIKSFSNF